MQPKLDDIFSPSQPLPPDEVMIAKALEILEQTPHGQRLVDFARQEKIDIKIMATPYPAAYLPETRRIYIGFSRNHPMSPSAFILMLAGILREAEQEVAGILHPPANAPRAEHIKISLEKHEDKLWYMCTVAVELDTQDHFTKFKFLDELRKMGHDEIVALYLKQEGKSR